MLVSLHIIYVYMQIWGINTCLPGLTTSHKEVYKYHFCKGEEWLKLPQRKWKVPAVPSKSQQKLSMAKGEAESFQQRGNCWAPCKVQFSSVWGVTKKLASVYRDKACWFTTGPFTHTPVRTATCILNQDDLPAHICTPACICTPPATTERSIFWLFLTLLH